MSSLRARVAASPLRAPIVKGVRAAQKRMYKPLEGAPGAPDFIGVGAVTSGGPWWHGLICSHPQARGPRNRRPAVKFFDDYCYKDFSDADRDRYYQRFAKAPGTISGEWTEVYLTQSWTLPLLARVAPDAKVLVSLSDPMVAYRKAFAARKARADRGDKRVWMTTAAADRSYGNQIAALYRFFDPEQVLVLQQEKCLADPRGEYKRTLQFLGLRDDYVPPSHKLERTAAHERVYDLASRVGVPEQAIDRAIGRPSAGSEPPTLWPDHEESIRVFLEPEVEQLLQLVPSLDLSLWPDFAGLGRARAATPAS